MYKKAKISLRQETNSAGWWQNLVCEWSLASPALSDFRREQFHIMTCLHTFEGEVSQTHKQQAEQTVAWQQVVFKTLEPIKMINQCWST